MLFRSAPEVEFYLQNAGITDIALEASARLFCTLQEAREVVQTIRNYV